MDDTDRQLISLLRKDARMNVAALATRLGVSRGTVTNRLRKLEDAHVIVGYSVRLRPDAEPNQIRAWMHVLVEGNQTRAVIAGLLGEPGVQALHDTNGRWDLLAELRADSMIDLSALLERVRLIKGIGATETSIHLQTGAAGDVRGRLHGAAAARARSRCARRRALYLVDHAGRAGGPLLRHQDAGAHDLRVGRHRARRPGRGHAGFRRAVRRPLTRSVKPLRRRAAGQPIVIRLALPPAAAVLMLSERSITSRSSGTRQSPGTRPVSPTIGPGRPASAAAVCSSAVASPC